MINLDSPHSNGREQGKLYCESECWSLWRHTGLHLELLFLLTGIWFAWECWHIKEPTRNSAALWWNSTHTTQAGRAWIKYLLLPCKVYFCCSTFYSFWKLFGVKKKLKTKKREIWTCDSVYTTWYHNLEFAYTVITPRPHYTRGTLKTHQMFSVHTTSVKFKNTTITGHFGFVVEENSVRENNLIFVVSLFSKTELRFQNVFPPR